MYQLPSVVGCMDCFSAEEAFIALSTLHNASLRQHGLRPSFTENGEARRP